ncbi:alkane 1-monooxygenase [Vibrio hangzhouensis]|uniref:alkane 1-monooxygenase n=1 Tax=Vibrio hangzhouensis TaxID=462991 RepID=UPI001C97075E|nr:alkane 1-monooxygenase [Vibrio hangzhouensis]MBY6197835.1 alkane 1-monooxygenase [Vibrio hangzhouensis]
MIQLKRTIKWLLALLPLLVMVVPLAVNAIWRSPWPTALSTLIVLFAVLPIVDELTRGGKLPPDYPASPGVLRTLPILVLPLLVLVLIWGAWYSLSLWQHGDYFAALTTVVSMGVINGTFGINAAHELLHKRHPFPKTIAGVLLSLSGYGGFKIEHVFGHHKDVATKNDPSSAPAGVSFYAFVLPALWGNQRKALKLQQKFRSKLQYFGYEYYLWQALTLLWMVCATYLLGLWGLIYFILQGFVAMCMLEMVNYIEHYGLTRKVRNERHYEPVGYQHSWDSNHLFSNYVLFQLPRHSDHHMHANKPFYLLEDQTSAPKLPFGYASLVLLALLPPLWFRVMKKALNGNRG